MLGVAIIRVLTGRSIFVSVRERRRSPRNSVDMKGEVVVYDTVSPEPPTTLELDNGHKGTNGGGLAKNQQNHGFAETAFTMNRNRVPAKHRFETLDAAEWTRQINVR